MRREVFKTSIAEKRAAMLFLKNYWKSKERRKFLIKRGSCIQIQKIIRGFITRIRVQIMTQEYKEWLILNPKEEDKLHPDVKNSKKKKKGGKGHHAKKKDGGTSSKQRPPSASRLTSAMGPAWPARAPSP